MRKDLFAGLGIIVLFLIVSVIITFLVGYFDLAATVKEQTKLGLLMTIFLVVASGTASVVTGSANDQSLLRKVFFGSGLLIGSCLFSMVSFEFAWGYLLFFAAGLLMAFIAISSMADNQPGEKAINLRHVSLLVMVSVAAVFACQAACWLFEIKAKVF